MRQDLDLVYVCRTKRKSPEENPGFCAVLRVLSVSGGEGDSGTYVFQLVKRNTTMPKTDENSGILIRDSRVKGKYCIIDVL